LFNTEVSALARRGTLSLLIGVLLALAGSGFALAQAALPDILAVRVSATPDRARMILDLSDTTEFALASLSNPERIAIDIKSASIKMGQTPAVAGHGLVASFTVIQADAGRARAELTLSQPAVVQQAYVLTKVGDQPARLVVDLIPTSENDFQMRAAADMAAANAQGASSASVSTLSAPGSAFVVPPEPSSSSEEQAPAEPASSVPETSVISSADSSAPAVSSEAPVAQPPPSPPPKKVAVNQPPSQSRPLIVLDPGHGGQDYGATAPNGDHEKDITLAFALQLRDLLVASGRFDVAMTRNDDTYLTLNQRVTLARQNRADLFVSLHADTFQEADIRGASIYTRDEKATDVLDKVLADGENRADVVAGYAPPDAKPAVVNILLDLMRRQVRQRAYLAAEDIVKAMEPNVALRRFPVRQADFFVLQAPDVPSMLIELGFLSNSDDIINLESPDWRDKMVKTIAQGIASYFADLSSGGSGQ